MKFCARDSIPGEADDGRNFVLVIAFRGTRIPSYLDLLTDIQLTQDMIGCRDFGIYADEERGLSGNDGSALVSHSGFLRAYFFIHASLARTTISSSPATCRAPH